MGCSCAAASNNSRVLALHQQSSGLHQHSSGCPAACNLYISEGRNQDILEELEEFIAQDRMVPLVHTHTDAAYNRTGFTLASQSSFMVSVLHLPRLQTLHIAMQPSLQ